MRITELEIHDLKAVRWVRLQPVAGVNVVSGNNGAGKSTVLDAICYSIGGKALVPEQPIRDKEDSAVIRVALEGDPDRLLPPVEIVRRFDREADGKITSTLTIYDRSSPDKEESPAPQTLLNDLLGRTTLRGTPIAFDPLAFCRLPAKDQVATVKQLAGIDFAELDQQAAKLTEERRILGREGATLAGAIESLAVTAAAEPNESPESIKAEYTAAKAHNDSLSAARAQNESLQHEIARVADKLDAIQRRIDQLTAQLKQEAAESDALIDKLQELRSRPQQPIANEIPLRPIVERLEAAYRAAAAYKAQQDAATQRESLEKKVEDLRAKYASKTSALKAIADTKAKMLAEAKWPVADLGFDDAGLTFRGRPLSQASSAERLEVAVAVGCALNSTLKVMLIREGSLLDDAHMKRLAEIAEQYDAQVFLEVVGERDGSQLVMRSGVAVQPKEPANA